MYKSYEEYCYLVLEEAKTKRSRQSRRNWRKTYGVSEEDNKTEVWTLLDKGSQLYIAEDNKDADGSVDSPRWREPIIYYQKKSMHEARIRRESIL